MADNKKITFHVVRSVKGGSGKTTFALHYVIKLANEKENEKQKQVLYLDADVHASETRNNLFEGEFGQASGPKVGQSDALFFSFAGYDENDAKMHSLNTYIHPYKGYYSKLSEIIINAKLAQFGNNSATTNAGGEALNQAESASGTNANEIRTCVDMIFADPDEHGRRVFGSLFQSAGQAAVGVGAYVAKIKTLLKYILECGKQYTDVVLDMPPGSDTFSEHLMDCIINFVSDNTEKCKLCVYYVATRDRAHIRTAAEAAIDHLHLMRAISPIEICFVDNEGSLGKDPLSKDIKTTRAEYKELIQRSFTDNKQPVDYELDRLEYYSFSFDGIYKDSSVIDASNNKGVFFSGADIANGDEFKLIKKIDK